MEVPDEQRQNRARYMMQIMTSVENIPHAAMLMGK
jgi:hypothetical protein